jgi:hypothetical protein
VDRYFLLSPFRSASFVVTTPVVVIFEFWAFWIQSGMDARGSYAAVTAVQEIAVLPALAWVYALLLHWEIRNLAKTGMELPPKSRLRELQQALPLMVLLVSFMMVEGLRVAYPRR